MPRLIVAFAVVALVSACGADGAPTPPQPGVAVTGQVKVGVSGS